MRRRVEEALDLLGIAEIRSRPLLSISAGQQQRVAIAAALTKQPRVLVLDEPTSALDPSAAEEVLAALTRLVDDLGTTLLVAEHRLERVAQYPDRVVWLPARAVPPRVGSAQQVLADATIAPPVVALARLAGWSPPPLSVRDARRVAGPLRSSLAAAVPARANSRAGAPIAAVRRLAAGYAEAPVLREVSLELHAGEVTAVMGRNGAGKSTLLRCLVGLHRPDRGEVRVTGRVGLVPQQPTDLLYSETVARECRAADRDAGAAPGTTQALLDLLAPGLPATAHPRDLSEGQRLCLALAVVLAAAPRLLLLDEPTRGLDYPAKTRLVTVLRRVAGDGHAVVLVTHDVELAAEAADRVVVLAGGETVTDGPAAEVLTASAAFAPQVAKVLSPVALLTTSDVRLALAAAGKR
jgi:energy-coupling factor transport system ATP-binding protein